MADHAAIAPETRARLGRRAKMHAGASVAYDVAEGVIAISAGIATGSIALVGSAWTLSSRCSAASSSCGSSPTRSPRPVNARH